MAGRRRKNASGITGASIRQMLEGRTGPGPHTVTMSPEQAKALLTEATVVNGRGGEKAANEIDFKFSGGRFDSFTAACDGLDQAEALYGFPFRAATDHLFLYTKLSSLEPSVHDGYALFVREGRLCYFAGRRGGDGRLMTGDVYEVGPDRLLDHLNRCNGLLKDDTVFEQIRWVREVQSHGLLAAEYPEFAVVSARHGRGGWLSLRKGAPTPRGFVRHIG